MEVRGFNLGRDDVRGSKLVKFLTVGFFSLALRSQRRDGPAELEQRLWVEPHRLAARAKRPWRGSAVGPFLRHGDARSRGKEQNEASAAGIAHTSDDLEWSAGERMGGMGNDDGTQRYRLRRRVLE